MSKSVGYLAVESFVVGRSPQDRGPRLSRPGEARAKLAGLCLRYPERNRHGKTVLMPAFSARGFQLPQFEAPTALSPIGEIRSCKGSRAMYSRIGILFTVGWVPKIGYKFYLCMEFR